MIVLNDIHDDLLQGLDIMRSHPDYISDADLLEARLIEAYTALTSSATEFGTIDEDRVEAYRLLFLEVRENLRVWYAHASVPK